MAKQNKAEILTIGDEILYGQINDTNSQWISKALDAAGFRTIRKTTVGDGRGQILQAFREAAHRADLVLITGGLGPTADDLTKPCLAEFFNCALSMNEKALKEVSAFFQSKGLELTELNRQQAMLPDCCEPITNELGTAPGMWIKNGDQVFVSMPGVPFEMKHMMTRYILPKLAKTFHTEVVYHRVIKTIGIGESWLSEKIAPWADSLPDHISLAYLPSLGQVKLRLTASGSDLESLKAEVAGQTERLYPYAGKYIYGFDNDEIESVVGNNLRKEHLTLATAESCTGGFLGHSITRIPGASDYFKGGVIAYANEIKVKMLGVDESTLDQFGAVSEETVRQMAEGVAREMGTDIGLATTGVAGPDGGSPEKPVGTVWIGCHFRGETIIRKLQLWKDREVNIQASSIAVLNLLRITLSKTIEEKT